MSTERCLKEEENNLAFYVNNSKENQINGVAAAEAINTEDTIASGELKNRKHKNLNRTGLKRKCMDNSPGKCQRKLIRTELGNGCLKVI